MHRTHAWTPSRWVFRGWACFGISPGTAEYPLWRGCGGVWLVHGWPPAKDGPSPVCSLPRLGASKAHKRRSKSMLPFISTILSWIMAHVGMGLPGDYPYIVVVSRAEANIVGVFAERRWGGGRTWGGLGDARCPALLLAKGYPIAVPGPRGSRRGFGVRRSPSAAPGPPWLGRR
jgi:hypothetical protein